MQSESRCHNMNTFGNKNERVVPLTMKTDCWTEELGILQYIKLFFKKGLDGIF